MAKAMSFLL